MKVAVFSTHSLWPNHRETELEIIQGHLDKNDSVYRFYCNGVLPVCDLNPNHHLPSCMKCRDMEICGKKLLSNTISELSIIHKNISIEQLKTSFNYQYGSIEELKKITHDNFDAGYAALSSVVSLLREPAPDLKLHEEKFENFLYSSLAIYLSALEYFKEIKPDVVYVFNGRFAHVKPVLRAAQACNIQCMIHERGSSKYSYELFENTTPHDRQYFLKRMNHYWDTADEQKRVEIGSAFFEERVKGKEQGWHSFTTQQQKGLLPADWDNTKRNVVIFNSSEDEFASIGEEWKNDLYENQVEAIKKIVADCSIYTDIHFYLRVHPNLIGLNNSEIKAIGAINYPNLTIIEAESKISTYDLLFNCEKVIAFGSSVGIEAVYWDKPSIQAGKSFYFDLNVTYKPSDHQQTIQLIADKLEPKDKTPALKYGFYFKTYGIPFKIYKPIDLMSGTYKNVDLDHSETVNTKVFKFIANKKIIYRFAAFLRENYQQKKLTLRYLLYK
ncbi:MAG: hypothetical protein V4556_10580 [Bacteroidota bacterium]